MGSNGPPNLNPVDVTDVEIEQPTTVVAQPSTNGQVNGVERSDFGADQIVVRELPADVVLEWGAAIGG